MKLIKCILIILTFSWVTVGCHEEALEEEVFSDFNQESLFNNLQGAEATVNGLYASFGASNDFMARRFWVLTELPGPAVASDAGLNDRRQLIDRWAWDPDNVVVQTIYQELYIRANRINAVVDNLETLEDTRERPDGYNWLDRLKGEARFFRALYNYWITGLWGDTPLRKDEFQTSDEFALPVTSAAERLAFILEDLEFAIPRLPEFTEYDGNDEARVSRGAARTLAAKVHLMRATIYDKQLAQGGDLDDALAQIAEMEAAGVHGLADEYRNLWYFWNGDASEDYAANNYEKILDIKYSSTVGLQGAINRIVSPDDSGFGASDWGNLVAEYPFLSRYHPEDKRYEATYVLQYGHLGDPDDIRTYDAADPVNDGYQEETPGITKWIDNQTEVDREDNPDITLLRYADVILMKAEALNEKNQGPTPEAYAALNRIRSRAGVPDLAPGLDYLAFKDSLYIERTKELIMEGHAFFDLQRFWDVAVPYVESSSEFTAAAEDGQFLFPNDSLGRVSDLGPLTVIRAEQPKHWRFPFPRDEIQANNGVIEQNPGYDSE